MIMRFKFFNSEIVLNRFSQLMILLMFFVPVIQLHAETIRIDSEKQYEFAEQYFSDGEYSRAIDEYKRFLYFFPDNKKTELVLYKTAMAYYYNRQYKEAVNSFSAVQEKYLTTDLAIESAFKISECYMKMNRFGPAINNLRNLALLNDNIDVKDGAYYKTGWIYLDKSWLEKEGPADSWGKASEYFEKISEKNRGKYRVGKISAELERVRKNKNEVIHVKNPDLAAALSVIPGAGFAYCGRYRDALVAFLLNGALIYAAYESFDNGNDALGSIITFVELGFYSGNIYGAKTSAHKYNRDENRNFIQRLKQNTSISLGNRNNDFGLIVSLNFKF